VLQLNAVTLFHPEDRVLFLKRSRRSVERARDAVGFECLKSVQSVNLHECVLQACKLTAQKRQEE
jgi:hypothetical protein